MSTFLDKYRAYSWDTGTDKTSDYAAKLCDDYEYGGYDDWFLPSSSELAQMYTNLHGNGAGSFANDIYWSSSEYSDGAYYVWVMSFSNGNLDNTGNRIAIGRVRAIRAF